MGCRPVVRLVHTSSQHHCRACAGTSNTCLQGGLFLKQPGLKEPPLQPVLQTYTTNLLYYKPLLQTHPTLPPTPATHDSPPTYVLHLHFFLCNGAPKLHCLQRNRLFVFPCSTHRDAEQLRHVAAQVLIVVHANAHKALKRRRPAPHEGQHKGAPEAEVSKGSLPARMSKHA